MALQAALPPTDSSEFRRSALLRRLADAQARAEANRPKTSRARGALAWDPAEFFGVSPYVMMGICAQAGATIGLLVFSTFQIAAQASPASAVAQPVSIQPAAQQDTAPSQFVIVADLPAAALAVDDYYFYLRQGLYDQAWALTDDEFRRTNYPSGFDAYYENWAAAQAMEVLSLDLVWQSDSEAHLLGEIQEGASGLRWRNSYVLRYDAASDTWRIHAIAPAG